MGAEVRDCKTKAEIIATYKAARRRLYHPRPKDTPRLVEPAPQPAPPLRLQIIRDYIATQCFGMAPASLLAPDRRAETVERRNTAILLAWELTHASTTVLGRAFKRDHASIINSLNRIRTALRENPALAEKVAGLRADVRQHFGIQQEGVSHE